jgi:hypothetical protein
MSETHGGHSAEGVWPDSYEPPTLEPVGSVWERTGSVNVGLNADAMFPLVTP